MIYQNESLPENFVVPREYLGLKDNGVEEIGPWMFPGDDSLTYRLRGLRQRFPSRVLLPFAKRSDRDDVACWTEPFPSVCVIHDFEIYPGTWGDRFVFSDIRAWIHWVLEDLMDYPV